MNPKKIIHVDGFTYQLLELNNEGEAEMMQAARIIKSVCSYFEMDPDKVFIRSRKMDIVLARHTIMYLLSVCTCYSLTQIGEMFGQDHTSVIHAREKIQGYIDVHEKQATAAIELQKIFIHN